MPRIDVSVLWESYRDVRVDVEGASVSLNELHSLAIRHLSILELASVIKINHPVTPEMIEGLRTTLVEIIRYTKEYWPYLGHREWTMGSKLSPDLSTKEGKLRLIAAKVVGLRHIEV